ncbi:hypothetical protein EFA46_004220 [Halarchaeum sp. CBA1220]|uniref:hypothetical protein n=1 Tax=Halarchaeum sp. CBA1220 TaxID=1853682 RepID=UPI000F3A9695|nr:hypothetical protein [Halarchaeum sp. CBA1220]QLC33438.1 hypothetical protein EFA46_004220 [Halarchaeum sp. CBA1220]
METTRRVRVAAACCIALGLGGAGLLYARSGFARPAALAACALVAFVGVLLSRRAAGAGERKPDW